ncbi:MAG: PQQ-dependent sugar dehydrogenase [Ignavibacteriae bacterium]|nr:PQQ-dependent sugar dehydrogenase [Ignavibacteriota bacterium]
MTRSLRLFLSILTLLFGIRISQAQQYALDTLARNPDIAFPVCLVFTPDTSGKFFFTEKSNGRVRIYDRGLIPTPFTTVSVTSSGEQGLLGVTLHPQYPDSPFVYIFYTRTGDRANIVVRYRDSSSIGVDPRLIVEVLRTNTATNHNGGNIHFGPDGKLYVTVGEYASSSNAQDSSATNLRGKILRLNPDGSVPPDNPFVGRPFWSIGHRNSFDFTWDSETGKMYCSENGPSCDDEVNLVPPRGNMGWPVEGNCSYSNNPLYVRPLYYFPSSPLPALTGIAVYRARAFPRLRGKILFTGNSTPTLWTVTLTEIGDTIVPGSFSTLFTYSSGFADVEIGPDGNIYLTNGPYSANRILRLRPMLAAFTTMAPTNATQDVLYSYTPTFSGTPPGLSIVSGPDGMVVDSTTWSVHWTPTNAQALQQLHNVTLRAENGAGSVEQSYTIFVTNVNDPPGAFTLLSPAHDTTYSVSAKELMVPFAWSESIDPDLDTISYVLQVDTISTFDSPSRIDTSAGTQTSLSVEFPAQTRSYYWRVKATDGIDTVVSSSFRRFNVTVIVSVKEEVKEVPKESVLEQNFPNPFNPTTNIVYTIPKGGHVRLAVFNLLGQEVALIFEGTQAPGTYELMFNSADLPTGIYFYRIQSPDFVETKKMIVTK